MRIGILPAIGLGALFFAALRQQTKKAIEKISVGFDGIKAGWPPKVKLSLFNPTSLKVEIIFIRILIFYREIEVARLSDTETRIIQPGANKLTLEIKPTLSALALINAPKGPRIIRVTWEIGTKLYSITGEKSTTL